MHRLNFTITNLTCDACIKVSTMTLRKLPGVMDVHVDLSTGAATIQSEELIHPRDAEHALTAKGYTVAF
ncbi:heavy-metal-associated domain-containing protein [Candidatus Uhrbacteria bacterium]|nr:heavy-metal-associated domain-containing protein [Candidatus Uhrbacteria bacterium]